MHALLYGLARSDSTFVLQLKTQFQFGINNKQIIATMTKHTANYIQDRAEHTGRLLRLITLGISFLLLSGLALNLNAQCPTPTNDATMATTGSGANPATTLAPISYIGTVTAGADETRMLVYMNTVDQFDIPSEITAADLPAVTTFGAVVDYNGKGQQLMTNYNQASSIFFVASNLEPSTTYYFYTVKVARCGTEYSIDNEVVAGNVMARTTAAGLSEIITAKDVVFGTAGDSNIPLNSFTGISSPTTPTGYVIKFNNSNSFTPISNPTDPATLTANNLWQDAGEQIVYVGNSESPNIDITGLDADTEYYFQIYAYYGQYFQQTGHNAITTTAGFKSPATITLTGNTATSMTATVDDSDLVLSATTNSTNPLIYQMVSAPAFTELNGSTITFGKAGVIEVDVIAQGDASVYTTSERITISVNKTAPTITFDPFTVQANSKAIIPYTSSSDGYHTITIEGSANGAVLSGIYDDSITVAASGNMTTLRLSVPETDYHLASSLDTYVTSIATGGYFTTDDNLWSITTGGTAVSVIDFSADPTATGKKGYSTAFINDQIWGVTSEGGANNKGGVYRVDPDGSNFELVASFTSIFSSGFPTSIQEFNGKVYGLTFQGGSQGGGTLWSANFDGTGYTVLHEFSSSSGLYWPFGHLVEYDGKLWGSTYYDATNNRGGIFSIDYDGSNYAVEYLCTFSEPNPQYGITLWNGILWFPSSNKIYGFNPTGKYIQYTLYPNGTSGAYEPVVINNELWVVNNLYIEKFTGVSASPTIIHTFSNADDVNNTQGQPSFDGVRIWGTAQDATASFPTVYSLLPDGSDFRQEYKGTVSGQFPSNNVTIYSDIQNPTITFANQTVEHLSVTQIEAQTNSTEALTYELIGDATSSNLNGTEFTAGNAGTLTVRASTAGNNKFNAGFTDATFTIIPTNPTATFSDITADFADPAVTLAPDVTTYTGGTIAYAFVDGGSTTSTGPNTGSSISGNQLTIGTPGTETIRATFPATSNFNGATFDFQLTINNATADLSGFVDFTTQIGQDNQTLSVSSAPNIAVSYNLITSNTGSSLSGANNSVFTVGNSTGVETIRVTVTEANYNATTKDIVVTVDKALANITWNLPNEWSHAVPLNTTNILNATADIPGSFNYNVNGFSLTPGFTRLWIVGTSYTLTAIFTPDDLTNYQVSSVSAAVTSAKEDLVIQLDDKNKNSASADPAFTYTLVEGVLVDNLFVPMTRQNTSNVEGTYAITIDNTVQSTQDDGESADLICPSGFCVWGTGDFVIYQEKSSYYNITILDGELTVTDKTALNAGDLTFNAPGMTYDGTPKTYTVTPNVALSPALPSGEVDLTYEGIGSTSYASSSAAPTDGGTYRVTGTVNASNANYGGSLSETFTITPATTSITLNLPGSPLPYTGSPQGISPTANDVDGNPTVELTAEYSDAFASNFSTTAPTASGTYNVSVNVSASASSNYTATEATGTFIIEATTQIITFNPIPEVACGQTQIDLTQYASSNVGNTLTFTSSDPAVATISGGIANIIGAGTTTITASQVGDINAGAAVDVTQDLTVSASQEYFSVDNPADVRVCNSSSFVLPGLTTGDYYTEAGGTGTMLSAGATITETTTLYVYGVSAVNATCTDENSFTITIGPVLVDDLADVTATGSYTLPVLTNGNYFTATGGTGTPLNAGDQITSTQTVYIYAEEAPGCNNETSFIVTIEPNPALHFEQVTNYTDYDYLSVPDNNSLDFTDHFTYEAWVNFEQLTELSAGFGWRCLMAKSRYTDSYALMYYPGNNTLRFYHAGFAGNNTDYVWSTLTAGSWHHVAVKLDGTNNKASILIDGVVVASSTDGGTGVLVPNTEPLLIGAGDNRSNDPYPFDGAMDEIRFWNIARTDSEISNYKDIKLQGNESGLVLYYDFSEGTIDGDNTGLSVVPDQSSSGNDATFNNFALSGSVSNYVNGSGNGVQEGISQTITFNALSNVTFGDAGFSLSATASSGLDITYASSNTSVATVSGNTVTIVGAGITTITASQVGDATYLPAGNVDQTLTVDPFATSISLNLPGTNPAYDGSAQAISPSANDISSNPTLALVTEYSVSGMNSFSTTVPVDAGTYDVRANLDGETNYSASEATGSYTIDQVALSITADNRTITYGDNANTGNTVTYDGFVNSETAADLSGTLAFASISQTDAGSYTGAIDPSGLTSANYSISYVAGDLTINQRAITVTADAKSKTYGDADPTLSYQVTTGALQYSDAFTGALSRATGENVGTYAINQNTLDAGSNYVLTYVSDDLTISERSLTIMADSQTKVYGDADPTLSYQITDGALQFSDALSGEVVRVAGETVGTYTINQGTLTAGSNYFITYIGNILSITARPITITADAQSKTYGDVDPALTYQLTSGALQFSDAISGALSRATGEDIGTYAIAQGTLTAGSNYVITFVSDDLTITARSLFVRAETVNKVYGDADPSFTPVIASGSLAFSDTFTGSLTRDAGEDAGAYTIRQGTLTAGPNYAITFISNGALNITEIILTVTADAKSKIYGDADPSLTYQLTSGTLQFSDAFTGTLSRDAGEDAGVYTITQGTLSAGSNYFINYVPADLTVNSRALEITADAKIKTYGNADPSLTYQITSGALQGGDVLTGALSRDAGEDVGTYAISQGTLSAGSNYDVTYVSDNLTIGTAAIEVTADAQAKTYGDADPTLSYSITSGSLQFSDTFSGALTRNSGESIGTYAINQGSLTAGSNYVLSYISDDLTISTRAIEITADDQSKTVGGSDPALTYTITNGALQFSDVVSGSLTRTSGETVGDYPITQGTLDLGSNYNLTFVPGTLTITSKLTQTITFGPLAAVTFGDANFDLSATGGASGNPVTFVSSNTAVATISGNTVTIVGGGTTNITASQLGDATYEDAADVVQSLTVNKASQSITVTTATSMNLIDNSSIVLSATGGGSGNPVTFSLFPGTDATIAADGVTLTPNSAGLINVNVNQAGDDNYESAFTIFSLSVNELYVWDGLAWNSVSTPPKGSDILFAGNYTLSGSFEVESATIQTGATVTIPDGSVFISNTEMNSIDGSVVVESGGSLVTYGDVFGANYTIERTTTFDQSTGRYSIVGSPIQNANFSVLGSNSLVYGYDQSELYNPTGNAGLDRFKTPTTLGITEMAVGKGYFSAFTGDANGQINFVGTPNTDDINVTLDFTDHAASEETDFEGFNLISNPYPSAISYSSFITGNSAADINGSIYLWDDFDSQNSRGDNSDYLIVNTLGNTDSRSNGEAKWDGNIRSGQGFFVKANSATSVSFTNSMRVTGNNTDGGFFRVDESEIQSLKLRLSDGNSTKAIVIGFAPDATLDMDSQYDAMSWSGNDYAFYSLSGTKQLAIQGLPQFYTGEIALGFYASEEGQQTISLMDVKNQEGIDVVFLKDKLTGEVINLREQSYTFTVSAGETNDRFVLQAFPNNVTGVEEKLEQQIFSYSDYGNLYVVFKTNDIKEANFTMFDLSGRMLLNQNSEINANRWQVDTDKIPTNIYILMIKTEKGIWKQKVKVE